MSIPKVSPAKKAELEASRAALEKWILENAPKPEAAQVGGPGMVVMRDDNAIKALQDMRDNKGKELTDLKALLLDEAKMSQLYPPSVGETLDAAQGIAFKDPNAERARSLAAALAGFSDATTGPAGSELPDAARRAQAALLSGSAAAPAPNKSLMGVLQYISTMMPGAQNNQRTLEAVMQQINDARTSGKLNFEGLNQTAGQFRSPAPDVAATRANLEAVATSSGKTIEQVLQDTLSGNKAAADELATGVRGLGGLAAEARQKIKGRQVGAIAGTAATLGATGTGIYLGSGPDEIDKQRKMFYDTFYAGGGGPGAGILSPKDDKEYGEALSQAFGTYATKMLGEPGSARYKSYGDFVTKNRATIDALGKGDLSFTADDEGLKEFRRGLADFYARNGYKEDKPLAFGYKNKEGKPSVFMTGKKGDRGGRLLDKGEFQMMDE